MQELTIFFERHGKFALSLLFLTASLLVAGYSAFYTSRATWTIHANAIHTSLKQENSTYEKQLKAHADKKKSTTQNSNQIQSLPAFLERINTVAQKTNVIIHKLTPAPENKFLFTIQIIEDYFKFIRFSSILESLNVTIHNIEVHPYDISKSPPIHVINFTLVPRADAEELSNTRLSFLAKQVARTDKRNPFQRYAFNKEARKAEVQIDLTWVYKLSGIGRIGDDRYATINDQDYKEKDILDGMTITKITTKRVFLQKKSSERGTEKFQLKFRRVKKKK